MKLLNGLGWIYKRQKPIIIRYHYASKASDSERYFHRLLILYLPWRMETDLKHHESYESKFVQVRNSICDLIKQYEPYNDEVQDAWENMDSVEDMSEEIWDPVAPPQAEQNNENDICIDADHALLDPSNLDPNNMCPDNFTVNPTTKSVHPITLQARLIMDQQYYNLVRSLNDEQTLIHDFIFSWCRKYRDAQILGNPLPDPFHVFLSGGGGVGKTHTVHAIFQSAIRQLRTEGQNPDTPTVVLTASTGKAAVNIEGTTLHSAFNLPVRRSDRSNDYQKPAAQTLNTLRSRYCLLRVIVIDEISMVGGQTLSNLNLTLQDIFENDLPFGGVSILAVGDLLQLNPVGDRCVYQPPAKTKLDVLASSQWAKLFKLCELHTIVRQQSDPEFASLLSRLRVGEHTRSDIDILKSLDNTSTLPTDCVSLFSTNMEADLYNGKQLENLGSIILTIEAKDSCKDLHTGRAPVKVTSKSPHETGGLRQKVQIAVGAKYMHTKNTDLADGLVNGATGQITHIEINTENPLKGIIYVKFDSHNTGKEIKKTSKYPESVPVRAVSEKFPLPGKGRSVTVERTQFPGTLAWGMTVHKAQGSTYESMIGNMSSPWAPKPGQVYTMLSRVKSRKGLRLVAFDENKIKINVSALREMERLQQKMQLSYSWPIDLAPINAHLVVGHVNIRSLKSHYEDLKSHYFINKMNIICLTETKVTDYSPYNISGMSTFSVNSTHGCAIYSALTVRQHFQFSGIIEAVAVITEKRLIVCVYIPPNRPWSLLEEHIGQLLTECVTIKCQHH